MNMSQDRYNKDKRQWVRAEIPDARARQHSGHSKAALEALEIRCLRVEQ